MTREADPHDAPDGSPSQAPEAAASKPDAQKIPMASAASVQGPDADQNFSPGLVAEQPGEALPTARPTTDDLPVAGLANPDVSETPAPAEQEVLLPPDFQNFAGKGGAMAAMTLGLLAIFGAFVTQWSVFNSVAGLVLGAWGLSSPARKTAIAGIVACLVGASLCVWLW